MLKEPEGMLVSRTLKVLAAFPVLQSRFFVYQPGLALKSERLTSIAHTDSRSPCGSNIMQRSGCFMARSKNLFLFPLGAISILCCSLKIVANAFVKLPSFTMID